MAYECQVNDVELHLKEAGQQLSFPPSSTKHLLDLLDKIEQLLTFVGQLPSISMQGALVPSMGALIGDELIKHPDINIKVSVASCLSEIARITAPEQPYKDEIMKEIFQLNLTAFGELSNMNGHSYRKAVHILESVAKVKSVLLMLDLECDALVLAMFEQFLSKTKSTHPNRVYSDMETIMTLVIKESDEISIELLSLLVSHVKKENQNVSPVSWKLTEKVLTNCVDTLKPYSKTITKLIKSDYNSYAEVVTLLCQNANGNEHVETRSTKKRNYIDRDRLKVNENELETPKKGRPKNKKIDSYRSHEDTRRTRLRDKSKRTKISTGKREKQLTVTDDEISSDYEPIQPMMVDKVQNRRNYSSKKRISNASGDKETPKKWKHDLVGYWIEVWWPLDKMYYRGVVSSYDSIADRYKVLYADGDEELLDLCHEKWRMLVMMSPGQQREQETDVQSSLNTSAKLLKQKGKRKLGSSLMQEANSSSRKRPAPADSSKTESTKEYEMEVLNTPNTSVSCEYKSTEDPVDKVVKDGEINPIVDLDDTSGFCDVDNLKDDGAVLKPDMLTKSTDGEPNTSAELEGINVSCDGDNMKDELVRKPNVSRDLKLTEETIDKVEETRPAESNDTTQKSE